MIEYNVRIGVLQHKRGKYFMRILEEDVMHGLWMLSNQISGVDDLVRFWKLFGPSIERGPSIEEVQPIWHSGLKLS